MEHASFTTEFLVRLASRSFLKESNNCITGKQYILDRNPASRENDLSGIKRPENFKVVEYDESYSPYSTENQVNLEYFHLLIKKLAEDKVKVILLETPRFIGASDSVKNISTFYQDVETLTKNYSNIFFLKSDFFDVDSRDPFIFFDGSWGNPNSHLNGKGASIFNQQFFQWLKAKSL